MPLGPWPQIRDAQRPGANWPETTRDGPRAAHGRSWGEWIGSCTGDAGARRTATAE